MIYFTADTHLGHKKIQEYCPDRQRLGDLDSMNESIIESINSTCSKDDHLYHLGDVMFGMHNSHLWKRVHCKTSLVLGNHDEGYNLTELFSSISHYGHIRYKGINLVMMHYPIESWHKQRYGSYHLHGHCHNTLEHKLPRRLDVGVDSAFTLLGEFRPFSLEEIMSLC